MQAMLEEVRDPDGWNQATGSDGVQFFWHRRTRRSVEEEEKEEEETTSSHSSPSTGRLASWPVWTRKTSSRSSSSTAVAWSRLVVLVTIHLVRFTFGLFAGS